MLINKYVKILNIYDYIIRLPSYFKDSIEIEHYTHIN
jgi:hypothetical protein